MKKIYYLAMAIATMVSCQNENDVLVVQEEVSNKTFTASFENNSSRTALQGEENNVVWLENDLLSIFSGKSINKPFVLTKGENTTYGEFEPTSISAGTENNTSTGLSLSANVGYYPYDANVTVVQAGSAYEINATFPTEQTFSTSGTFGNGASPMVAVTSSTFDTELKFKNVGAIFRLQLQGTATITHVVFSADANLAGNCAITASNTSIPTVQVIKGSNTIVLDCGEGVQLSENEATNFVVAMLPVEISTGGITITIYDNAGKKMVYTHKETEPITIERSKAYTTAEVTYEGNEDANTPLGVQAALDAATTGTTIQLEPGVNYGTLVFRQNSNSKVVDITDIGGDATGNEKYRKFENITIIGAPGAVVDQIKFQASSWLANEIETEKYASYIDVKNLTVKNVTFSGNATAFNLDVSKASSLGIDGLTIDGCTMNDADGADRFVFQQISGYKQLADKSTSEPVMTTGVKNLTIKNCSVTGAYQVIETREMENLSITNNTIKNTTKHAMLLAVNTGKTYSGNVTITGNTADGINERFVRMAGAGTANVVINNNVITNYKGADADCIKVTDRTTGTIDTKNNTFEVSTAATLQATLDAATEGTIINLVPNVNYGVVYMGRPTKSNNTEMFCETHNYTTTNADDFIAHLAEGGYHTTPRYTTTLKNLTINGATGATIEGLVATSGHAYGDVYDYVLEKDYASGSAYYLTLNISNVTFSKVNFTGKIDINTSDETSVYDGITFDQCTFTTGGTASTNGAAIRYYNEANNGNVKNIKVQKCTFTNCYQGVYVHHVNGITVTSNSFTTTGHNAIAIQSHAGAVDLLNVVITNNTFNNIADRVIRFNEIGANSNITIQGNTATNSGDDANEVMKATTIASGVTTSISGNNWGDGAVVANDELKDK